MKINISSILIPLFDEPPQHWRDTPVFPAGVKHAVDDVYVPLQESPMLSDIETKIANVMGVTHEQFAHAKAKRSPFPDADSKFEPHDAADGDPDDDGPGDDDLSAGGYIARAKNHLESMDDPDDAIDADTRLSSAIDCLMQAKAQRAGVKNGLGQHARIRFAR